jgi:hypothetical protein
LYDLPKIRVAYVSLIRPFILPNLATRTDDLKPNLSFLASAKSYWDHYQELERPRRYAESVRIPELEAHGVALGLWPLRKKHTLNSYWKAFRLTLQKEKGLALPSVDPLSLLLPLKGSMTSSFGIRIKASGEEFHAVIYVYLFPFGACCVNMDIPIGEDPSKLARSSKGEKPFEQFIELIPNLKKSVIEWPDLSLKTETFGSFGPFSLEVSRRINRAIFKGGEEDVIPFSTHTFVSVMDTDSPLMYDDKSELLRRHLHAIAAVLYEKSLEDVSTLTDSAVKEILSCKLKNRRDGEIIFFRPNSTFLYASPSWVRSLSSNPEVLVKRLECMRHNYQSFFNVIFSVNRFLKEVLIRREHEVPEGKLQELVACFTKAFPLHSESPIYFKHAFEPIATHIGLAQALGDLRRT